MILGAGLDEAWAALSNLPPARGAVGPYEGVARLEEADDDTHTATLRLRGTGPSGPVAATITATLEPSEHGTRLHLATRANPAPDAVTIQEITERLADAIAPREDVAPGAREAAFVAGGDESSGDGPVERGRPRAPGRLVSAALHRMRRNS